jgi:hypothetical protein
MKLNSKWQLDLTLRNTHAGTRGIYFLIDFIIFFLLGSFLYTKTIKSYADCVTLVCVYKKRIALYTCIELVYLQWYTQIRGKLWVQLIS